TKTAAMEYAPQGIRVNAGGPAFIDTPLLSSLEPAVREGLVALHPAGRLGTPDEVAALTCFQQSNEASFVTRGHHLVDGCYTSRRRPRRRRAQWPCSSRAARTWAWRACSSRAGALPSRLTSTMAMVDAMKPGTISYSALPLCFHAISVIAPA